MNIQAQHGLTFVFLPQAFGGDNDSEIKACPSNFLISVEMVQRGKKGVTFGIVNADITHSHFSKLLNGPGSFYPQGYLCMFSLLVIWLTWIYELCW